MIWFKDYLQTGENIHKKYYRCRQDSNLRGETPMDFQSIALTTRPKMGQKGLPGGGGKGKREGKEGGKERKKRRTYTIYFFIYSLIFSTMFTHSSALIARFIITLIFMSLAGIVPMLWQYHLHLRLLSRLVAHSGSIHAMQFGQRSHF